MPHPSNKIRHIYILLDSSKSMGAVVESSGRTQLELGVAHLHQVGKKLGLEASLKSRLRWTIMSFSHETRVLVDAVELGPAGFSIPTIVPKGQTWFGQALSTLSSQIARDYGDPSTARSLKRPPIAIIITDGQPEGELISHAEEAKASLRALEDPLSPNIFVFAIPPMSAEALDEFVMGCGVTLDNRQNASLEQYWDLITRLIVLLTQTTSSTDKEPDLELVKQIIERVVAKPGSGASFYANKDKVSVEIIGLGGGDENESL